MTFISYAQNFEDVMLWRALQHVNKGFYIDVGANDAVIDSVTCAFYERGWHGINIEPMQQYFDQLLAQRPNDINLQLAVSDAEGELTFFNIPDTGLSTVDQNIAQSHIDAGREVLRQQVHVTTLSAICEKHIKEPIHFLKIDVEGLEAAVLRGMDFEKWRPWILVIEATRPQSQTTSHHEWEDFVLRGGYQFAYFDGLNHFYVANEQSLLIEKLKLPPNVFDDFYLRTGHSYSYPLTAFIRRVEDAEAQAHLAEVRVVETTLRMQQAEERAQQAEERTQQAEESTQQAQTLQRQAESLQREAEMQTQSAHDQLAAIYESTSWRITRPLRTIKQIAQQLFQIR